MIQDLLYVRRPNPDLDSIIAHGVPTSRNLGSACGPKSDRVEITPSFLANSDTVFCAEIVIGGFTLVYAALFVFLGALYSRTDLNNYWKSQLRPKVGSIYAESTILRRFLRARAYRAALQILRSGRAAIIALRVRTAGRQRGPPDLSCATPPGARSQKQSALLRQLKNPKYDDCSLNGKLYFSATADLIYRPTWILAAASRRVL